MKTVLAAVVALATTLLLALPAAAVSPSEAAHLCARNGFQSFQRADGTAFQNAGECVSYAVHTGTLQEVLDAHSVLAVLGGGAGCLGPDGNGDLTCTEGASGCISGAFNTPAPACPFGTSSFRYMNQYVWHPDGTALGDGTAVCSGCVVAGRTGEVDFISTGQGQVPQSPDNVLILSSGTWRISSATGALLGLSGSGTWSFDPTTFNHVYSGTISLRV
jgi:hypothetical protein